MKSRRGPTLGFQRFSGRAGLTGPSLHNGPTWSGVPRGHQKTHGSDPLQDIRLRTTKENWHWIHRGVTKARGRSCVHQVSPARPLQMTDTFTTHSSIQTKTIQYLPQERVHHNCVYAGSSPNTAAADHTTQAPSTSSASMQVVMTLRMSAGTTWRSSSYTLGFQVKRRVGIPGLISLHSAGKP